MRTEIEEYLDDLRAVGRSVETIRQYRWHLLRWCNWCEGQGIGDLRALGRPALRRWAAGIRDQWSAATCRTAIVAVRSFLRWCGEQGYGGGELAAVLKTPKRKKTVQRVARVEEVELLLAGCGSSPVGLRNAAMVALMFDSLLRVGEVCRLRLCDLDLVRLAVVVHGKGGAQRLVRFGSETGERLRLWLAVRGSPPVDLVFVGVGGLSPGQGMTRGGVRCLLRKLAIRAGVPHLSPHSLRRGGAVAMIEAGAPSRVVQFHGGWDDLEMLEWYTQQVDAAKVFDRYSPVNGMCKSDA